MGIVRGVARGLSQDSVKGGPGTHLAKSVLRVSQGVGALPGWSTLVGKQLRSQEAKCSFSLSASGAELSSMWICLKRCPNSGGPGWGGEKPLTLE